MRCTDSGIGQLMIYVIPLLIINNRQRLELWSTDSGIGGRMIYIYSLLINNNTYTLQYIFIIGHLKFLSVQYFELDKEFVVYTSDIYLFSYFTYGSQTV